jgi:hypothetical protein
VNFHRNYVHFEPYKINLLAGFENSQEQFADDVSVDGVGVDMAPKFRQVSTLRVEEQVAVGGFAIATGTTHLLDESFERRRHVVVNYRTEVIFVDSHAEGDGGNDDS